MVKMEQKLNFWGDWKRKTKLEENAIKSLRSAKKIILKNISRKEIISIYVKGSFVRREMNKKSDVDIVTILKTSRYFHKFKILEKEYGEKLTPKIQFSTYSFWELKTGKKVKSRKKVSAAPSRFVNHLEHHKLIYGKILNKDELYLWDNKTALNKIVNAFNKYFFLAYKNKKMGFSEIIKQVFWLIENEEKAKGEKPPHNWKKLSKSIKDKNHIIHETLKLRLHPTKDKKIRKDFLKKLKKHLRQLNKK